MIKSKKYAYSTIENGSKRVVVHAKTQIKKFGWKVFKTQIIKDERSDNMTDLLNLTIWQIY